MNADTQSVVEESNFIDHRTILEGFAGAVSSIGVNFFCEVWAATVWQATIILE